MSEKQNYNIVKKNQHLPCVSILLLSWNHEKFIDQCITSIANQSYKNIEVIYLDNNSSDDTYSKGTMLLEKSGLNFKSCKLKEGQSISKNFNYLLHKSSGEYIIPLSTDDWLHEECVKTKVQYYETFPHIGMLYSGGWIYLEDTKELIEADGSNFKKGRITHELINEANVLFFIAICYKRSVLAALGGWDENLLIEDMDLFIRISLQYDIDYIPKPLAYYRKISTSAAHNVDFMVKGWEQYYQKYKYSMISNMRKWMGERYRMYAALSLDYGNKKNVSYLLQRAFIYYPLNPKNLQTFFYFIRKRLKSIYYSANFKAWGLKA